MLIKKINQSLESEDYFNLYWRILFYFAGFELLARRLIRVENKVGDIFNIQKELINHLLPGSQHDSVVIPDDINLPCQTSIDVDKIEQWLEIKENEIVSVSFWCKLHLFNYYEVIFFYKYLSGCYKPSENNRLFIPVLRYEVLFFSDNYVALISPHVI